MATRYAPPRDQVFSDTGTPLPGAKLYFYSAGTSTPKATYSDAGLTVVNANPVIANSAGRFGDIFLAAGDYKVVLQTAAGVTVWTADPVAGESTASGGSAVTGNLLINGDFRINQRGVTTAADDVYSLDRWYTLTQTGDVTIAQQALQENGQANNIRLTQPDSSAKRMGLAQIVEACDSQPLRGAAVAMGGRIRCSLSQPIRYAILAWTGIADVVTSDVVADWTSTSYAPGGFFSGTSLAVVASGSLTPAANVWTDLPAITGTVTGSANNLIAFIWTEGTIAQTATLDVGLVRLVSGETAATFPSRPLPVELAMCQRFFYMTDIAIRYIGYAPVGATGQALNVPLPVTMRAAPSVTSLVSSGFNVTTPAVSVSSPNGFTVVCFSVAAEVTVFTYEAGNAAVAEL